MLNIELNDCTCAAYYHALQVWSFNSSPARHMLDVADDYVRRLYISACGYQPGVPGSGPEASEQKVLSYLLREGAPLGPAGLTHKITAYLEVDPRNVNDVKRTIADCGIAYIGLNVPRYIHPVLGEPPAIWDVQERDSAIVGGHAVILAGYNDATARVISWGEYFSMTWNFFAKYVDEAYAIADPIWFKNGGKKPGGLTIAELKAQMHAIATSG
ncbi:hypothetical protein [Bradyrhizobium sp.]|uniref:hypothetical protein n=1 Tax=Bradyrhizobium sp. TaxID=376 RepID=UPI003C5272A8